MVHDLPGEAGRAWVTLGVSEHRAVWDRFERAFRFRPGVHPDTFPAIREPHPSATYPLPRIDGAKRLPSSDEVADLESALLAAFRACTLPNGRIYALDWQHESFSFAPHVPFDEWAVPALPDGDYSIFLAPDFAWGVFGHPWERTICVFGADLLSALRQCPPRLFGTPTRER
jgi:hypothetical protein